jgi:hypothetical protein
MNENEWHASDFADLEAGNILGMNGPRPGSCVMCQLRFLVFFSGANSVSELLWVSLGSF